jgi:hypothetical protein
MTRVELNTYIDTNITDKTAVDSLTPTNEGNALKEVADYIDQQVPYKSYSALLSCTDSSTVTTTLISSNLGTVVWTRNSAGNYSGTLSGAFTIGKTLVLLTPNAGSYVALTATANLSANTVFLEVFNTTNLANIDYIEGIGIEIRVYN